MSGNYEHPGDAWTDVVTAEERRIYCDACAEEIRRERRERFEDGDYEGQRAFGHAERTLVGYFCPEPEDCCDQCGVLAANQHAEEA